MIPCKECYKTRTSSHTGLCYQCDRDARSRADLIAHFALPNYIPFPRALAEAEVALPCESMDSELFTNAYREKPSQEARDACRECPAGDWCLEFGMMNDQWGVWGGLSQSERRLVLAGLPEWRASRQRDSYVLIA